MIPLSSVASCFSLLLMPAVGIIIRKQLAQFGTIQHNERAPSAPYNTIEHKKSDTIWIPQAIKKGPRFNAGGQPKKEGVMKLPPEWVKGIIICSRCALRRCSLVRVYGSSGTSRVLPLWIVRKCRPALTHVACCL